MVGALFYLQLWSLWNRLRAQARRLRQPKYLAGALAGAAYFYFFFVRHMFMGGGGFRVSDPGLAGMMADYAALIEVGGAVLLGLAVAAAWIFPTRRASLDFTEPEIAFLFPAPISRTALIHYRILRSQLPLLFGALVMVLFSGRWARSGQLWMYWLGWWLLLGALELHRLGAAFVRTRLADRGVTTWRRRLVVAGVLVGLGAVFYGWARLSLTAPVAEDLTGVREIAGYLRRTAETGPWFWLLLPLRWMVRPLLAQSPGEFALALLPVAGVLAALYWWVLRSQVSFEEASIAQAATRAATVAAAKSGRWHLASLKTKRPEPFPLPPAGLRSVAFVWKNLIALGAAFTPRLWIGVGVAVVVAAMVMKRSMTDSPLLTMLGVLPLVVAPMLFVIGPQVMMTDLRQDLVLADALKTYPIPGWQLVLGEILAPVAVLTAVQWFCVGLGATFLDRLGKDFAPSVFERVALGLAIGLVAPGLNLVSFLIYNGAALLFPGWAQMAPGQTHGFEAMGRGILLMVGQMAVLGLALLLPAGGAAGAYFLGSFWLPWPVLLPGVALVALVVLLAEVYAGLRMLGDFFERMDVSVDPVQPGA